MCSLKKSKPLQKKIFSNANGCQLCSPSRQQRINNSFSHYAFEILSYFENFKHLKSLDSLFALCRYLKKLITLQFNAMRMRKKIVLLEQQLSCESAVELLQF